MKTFGLNPYLPYWENVPDGEPHVFGDRVYVFGSHDKQGGESFCEEDYVGWSAPIDDLGNWRCEGVIYKKAQDPINGAPYDKAIPAYDDAMDAEGILHNLYAPDVAQGPDGRYYLYYALDFVNVISVAVCDTPAGKYEFLGYVTREDGSVPNIGRWFDPAILSEESGNYLYYGFSPSFRFPGMETLEIPGAMMVKLADDMHTIISEPVCVANGYDTAKGTDYEEHPFFEASSIRKFGEWYYFVYSSQQMHELCYGMSKTPEGPFEYKGVIVSNGDIGYQGNELATSYYGNNHGGLVEINGKHYIFWHRHTHGRAFSRQGCADKVEILADGTIPQIEMTSCGLNDGALPARGKYESYIACHLTEADREKVGLVRGMGGGPGDEKPKLPESMTYITEEKDAQCEHGCKPFICNMRTGAVAGFKYFEFDGTEKEISLELRGNGKVEVSLDTPEGEVVAVAKNTSETWSAVSTALKKIKGVHALYVKCVDGKLDFASIEMK